MREPSCSIFKKYYQVAFLIKSTFYKKKKKNTTHTQTHTHTGYNGTLSNI